MPIERLGKGKPNVRFDEIERTTFLNRTFGFLKKIHFYIGTGERFYFFGYKVGISLTEVQCKIIQCIVSSIITYKGKLVETTQIDNQSIVILKVL